ncbi:hypothetical protein [Acidovorax sp. CF316]|uniref:hypothetical protein n=1 Tax=Acidovorax sp. CF316 TaxID=1144317 RepID=UPI000555C2C3|nr:hypothetical protein [Acidovorax sp. CF316]
MFFRQLALLAVLMLGLAGGARACSCSSSVSTQERVADASFIFVAQVVASEATDDIKEPQGWSGFAARYRLLELLKSDVPPPAQVYSGEGGGDCGVPLFPAISYVFFAGPEGNINRCSGTVIFIAGSRFSEDYLAYVRALAGRIVPLKLPPLVVVDDWFDLEINLAFKEFRWD